MKSDDENSLFKNVTRYMTPDERAKVERIDLNPEDVDQFMELLRNGLVEAASAHDAAVQNNMALTAEVSVRLSRPVYNETEDKVEQLTGSTTVSSNLEAKKVFKE